MSSKTLRLFVAIDLPTEVRQGLAQVQNELMDRLPPKSVRWTKPEGVHVTLKFMGDTAADKVDAIVQGLAAAAAGFDPFSFSVAGFGCFPNSHRPNVLWVGVPQVPKALAGLQRATDLQMHRLGYERERRPFSPHLTLGRVDRRISPQERQALAQALAEVQVGHLGTVAVQEVVLFQSDLRPTGAVYTALARLPLGVATIPGE
jgi:2'-5' RNA ligase